jgi:factor associated with neutral sphingomyelinase activation
MAVPSAGAEPPAAGGHAAAAPPASPWWSFLPASSSGRQQQQQQQQEKRSHRRFNLLMLEHGEYYFQDYRVVQSSAGDCPGRLKLCSRSLLFDPSDESLPCVKYPFSALEELSSSAGSSSLRLVQSVTVLMKEGGVPRPYRVCKHSPAPLECTFTLLHTSLEEVLRPLGRLVEIARAVGRGSAQEEGALLEPLLRERIDACLQRFDPVHLVDFREGLLLARPLRVDRVTPLLSAPGGLMLTDRRLYFQPAELNNVGGRVEWLELRGVTRIFKRRHLLRRTGLELFMEDGRSVYYNFGSEADREEAYALMLRQDGVGARIATLSDPRKEMLRWQRRELSNYDYLCFLNTAADRSTNDLTQYPVFPWVIADYSSATLDLESPATFRDLGKPIGALNAERLAYFRERLSHQGGGDADPPPFLYGTHYSTPGYVLFFLVRSAPEHMLCLQNGRFDSPDRMFVDVGSAWDSVLRNHADLKELIPEFYSGDGSFLVNGQGLNLGTRQSGERVGDVALPPWAHGDPQAFVQQCRRALESEHVSSNLHLWIDLIFGASQRGQAALEADNLFFHLTYEGAVDVDAVMDAKERASLEVQISEFGQCPRQLFATAHPPRDAIGSAVDLVDGPGRLMVVRLQSKSASMSPARPPAPPPQSPSVSLGIGTLLKRGLTNMVGAASATLSPAASVSAGGKSLSSPASLTAAAPHPTPARPAASHSLPVSAVAPCSASSALSTLPSATWKTLRSSDPGAAALLQLRREALLDLHRDRITGVSLTPPLTRRTSTPKTALPFVTLCTSSADCALKLSEASTSNDGQVTAATRRLFAGSDLALGCCAATRDGSLAVTGGWDNALTLYSVTSAATLSRLPHAHDDGISAMALHETHSQAGLVAQGTYFRRRLVTGGWDAAVRVWDMTPAGVRPDAVAEFFELDSPILAVAIDGTGIMVAAAAEGGQVGVWDVGTQAVAATFSVPSGEPVGIAWGLQAEAQEGDAACLVVATSDGLLTRYSPAGGLLSSVDVGCGIRAMDSDGFAAVLACADGTVRIFVESGGGARDSSSCFSPVASAPAEQPGCLTRLGVMETEGGGLCIATGCEQGTLRLWTVSSSSA